MVFEETVVGNYVIDNARPEMFGEFNWHYQPRGTACVDRAKGPLELRFRV